jgi:hypothetical protein
MTVDCGSPDKTCPTPNDCLMRGECLSKDVPPMPSREDYLTRLHIMAAMIAADIERYDMIAEHIGEPKWQPGVR